MTYKLTSGTSVVRIEDGTVIPADPENADYAAYLQFLAAGHEPLPVDVPPLPQRQDQAWRDIQAMRDHLSDNGGYFVSGKWFHSDEKSKTQQIGLVIAGPGLPPIPWKTMDGSFITMTPALAHAVFEAALMQDSAIFAVAEQHKAQMLLAADPLGYDFSQGWPATFPGA